MIEGTQQSNLQYGGNIMAILEYNVDANCKFKLDTQR